MKTYSITKRIARLIVFVLLAVCTIQVKAQDKIIYDDGADREVHITYRSQDTVKYYLSSRPDIVYVETMDHIRQIIPMNPSMDIPDSLSYSECKKKYTHYLHMTIGGPILIASGGILTGLGIAGLVSLSDEDNNELTKGARAFCGIVTGVGVIGIIAGIAMTASGATNMPKYKEKLHGFSFDLKCTPQVKGISVAYRF